MRIAPEPRKATWSEELYATFETNGDVTEKRVLPCWHEDMVREVYRRWKEDSLSFKTLDNPVDIGPAELFMTLVIPAYNEEDRLSGMLEEAVQFLETEYGTPQEPSGLGTISEQDGVRQRKANGHARTKSTTSAQGWEILVVNDGSTDNTLMTVQNFARAHILPSQPRRDSGPWTHRSPKGVKIPPHAIRMITLDKNRGKGGAVIHGMRHARGQYVLFADADGASKFSDLEKLLTACQDAEDKKGRAVAVGSRAHLVGSEAVVKRSKLRNFLMYSFHTLLWILTPPATSRIKDTQCGFKLFSRPSLPYIVPHMHMEGWIFDVEMLMLAESAGIPVVEVPIGWREVLGSKLNVIKDSLGMAWGLAILRIAWGTGIYRKSAKHNV
jgi:dolichyl-phosphate beta-glucosyltransferase